MLAKPARNVVMVVFDELPLTSLLGQDEDIDDERYPAFAELARNSIWFRGATAVHDSTALAVPAILEGRYPRPGLGSDYASHPRNLFTLLAPRYELHVSEEATGLCPPSLCEPTPGTTLSHIGHGRVERFRSWLRSIGPGKRRALWFKHVLFPHVPWQYLPSGLSYRHRPSEPIPGLNSQPGFGDPWLVELSYQRHLLQVGFADRLLGDLMARLRRTGLWRRSLVVVVADHGIGFHVGVDRRTVTPRNFQDLAPVPLFVKLPGQRRGLTVDKHVETIDLLPTILQATGIQLPADLDGRWLLRPSPVRKRQVTIFHRIGNRLNTLGGRYTFSVRELERRRRAAVRPQGRPVRQRRRARAAPAVRDRSLPRARRAGAGRPRSAARSTDDGHRPGGTAAPGEPEDGLRPGRADRHAAARTTGRRAPGRDRGQRPHRGGRAHVLARRLARRELRRDGSRLGSAARSQQGARLRDRAARGRARATAAMTA